MKIEKAYVEKLMVTEIDGLDPIAVYLEDHKPGRGKITITCFGKSWTAYWPAMGCGIKEFFLQANNGYLIQNLDSRAYRDVMAYDQTASYARRTIIKKRRAFEITKEIARVHWDLTGRLEDVSCEDDLRYRQDELTEIIGPFWYKGFPMEESNEYHYLNRIVTAVKNALRVGEVEA